MILWYQALLFFLLGGIGGAALALLTLREKAEQNVREEARRKAQRKLAERGRHSVAREDAGPPAKIHRARPRKSGRKP